MSFLKRQQRSLDLERRVRARVEAEADSEEEEEEEKEEEEKEEKSDSDSGNDTDGDDSASEGDGQTDSSSEQSDDDDDDDDPVLDASQLSFGTLAKAQASMPAARTGARHRPMPPRPASPPPGPERNPGSQRPLPGGVAQKPRRASKHAPTEQSSKRRVSRRRAVGVAATARPAPRDPRFLPLPGSASAHARLAAQVDRNYAFLDEYRAAEIRQLRAAVKLARAAKPARGGGGAPPPAAQRERLERALASLEGKQRAAQRRRREREVLDEQRRQEKEAVAQGKKPFFLKKSEQKKRVLVDRFDGMKKGQVDKAMERRRKKVAAREKKALPMARRGLGETGLG
ncbi:hypothetical protein P8C59_004177 [Phyllachora maydis]|uniref:rRNA biogenesis protein RRP36 n=1 Tax=Phyllachora maydis TaxID=1825666 RepID=A0AAD9MB20_9PEZI|nr:hypothetical protein P8C59_004177 [Phyllachora maydis]